MEVLWHKAWEFILKCVNFILNFFKRNPLMHLWWCLHATAKKIEKELKGVDLNVHAHVHPSVRKIHSLFSHPRNNRSLSTYAQFRLPLCCIEYTSTIMHTLHLYFLILICGLCDRFWLWSIMPVSCTHCATEGPWFCYSSCSPMFISNFLVWLLNRLVNCQ